MRVVVVVQARFNSSRLPGKVLRLIGGRPLITHLLDGLSRCQLIDGIVLATSKEPSDDPIADFALAHGVAFHRGPLDDVATRVLQAARGARGDALVRVSGDSPLLDPRLVDRAVSLFREGGADLVSNVVTRSFPRGQSVEVIACEALARAITAMTRPEEREHVTPLFYAHQDHFTVRSFVAETPHPSMQLSVDDAADLARCEAVLGILGVPAWQAGWEACARACSSLDAEASS